MTPVRHIKSPANLAIGLAMQALLTAAHAQASPPTGPTLFGVVDNGVTRSDTGQGTSMAMASGVIWGSRLGVRGHEDLGEGNRALYMLEMGLNTNDGSLGQGGLAFGRQAFVGAEGAGWGKLTVGRHYSVLHTSLATFTVSGLIWGDALNYFRDGTVLRINNSLRYESPEVAGFKLKSLYAFGGQANSSVGNVFNPSLDYKAGALQLGASYMRSITSATNTSTYAVLGGSYDFGVAKAAFANYRQRDSLAGSATAGKDAWELSAMVPMGVHSIWVSYGRSSGRAADTDAVSFSARYGYALSKRTSLYAGYSQIRNGAKSTFTFNSASNAGPAVAAGKNVNQVALGISHFF